MRITVLGGSGAWPVGGLPCTGHLVEHEGFRLVVDLGYAALPQLMGRTAPELIDAALFSHGHPDHCADLHPLLRARVLRAAPAPPLPLHAPPGSLHRVLALDDPGTVDYAYRLHDFLPGSHFEVGPFQIETWSLPHFVPSAGLRLTAGGRVFAYTGDTGPADDIAELARDADLLVAEASYPEVVPPRSAAFLSSASQAGTDAARARVRRLVLTHLMHGSDPAACSRAARQAYAGPIDIAHPGLIIDLGPG
ncbi:MAG: MBL fold metallo-hydrolase [Candidatus Dormibacteraeota bacterium]|nr:MBL fold metallo-hydrolase [Candidatus Dormibacteraeota bacterium]